MGKKTKKAKKDGWAKLSLLYVTYGVNLYVCGMICFPFSFSFFLKARREKREVRREKGEERRRVDSKDEEKKEREKRKKKR